MLNGLESTVAGISISVDSKATYVAQRLCNLACLFAGDERWIEATELTTDLPNIESTREAEVCQEKRTCGAVTT